MAEPPPNTNTFPVKTNKTRKQKNDAKQKA
jgi:hypothetical protein